MAINKPLDRPKVHDVLPLVRQIYKRHCAGCCLHILTDDGNCEQQDAEGCLQGALERKHPDCIQAAEMLVQMTDAQRVRVFHEW